MSSRLAIPTTEPLFLRPNGKSASKTKAQENHIQSSCSRLRCGYLRRVSTTRPGTLLPCLPSTSFSRQPRFRCDCHPPLPTPWAPPVAYAWRFLLNVASIPCRCPRYHLPAFFAATVHTSASTPKTNVECSVDPLVASNALRSSSRHLCQLFGCPPGLRPSPPAMFPSITRLGNRPSWCRATAPAKKSRRLRMVVSMFSHRVFLSAFAPSFEADFVSRR